MHPRIAELVNYLISARTHLDHALESVPADRRDVRPAPDRWSVADVLQHLTLTNAGMAKLFAKRAAAARAEGLGPDPETTSILWTLDVHSLLDRRRLMEAPPPVQPGDAVPADEAARRFDEAHRRLSGAIAASGDVALGRLSHPHPVLGPLNLYQWGIFAAAHEIRHAAQIREIGVSALSASPSG
jgi:hypothetical protein